MKKDKFISMSIALAITQFILIFMSGCCEGPPPSRIEYHPEGKSVIIWHSDGRVNRDGNKYTFIDRDTDDKISVPVDKTIIVELPRPAKEGSDKDNPTDATNIDPKFKKK